MAIIFWLSVCFIFYTYLGYPLWLFVFKKLHLQSVTKNSIEPSVSVVIAAHNEAQNIVARIQNLFSQDYPPDKLEVIVVSDGSTDNTIDLLNEHCQRNLHLVVLPINQGKAVALNVGLEKSQSEIVIFTDARQTFAPGVLRHLAANFADPQVGCVSGELIFWQDAASSIQAEMGAYWKYEKWIRKAESSTGSVVGATGAIYAVRRSLYKPLPQGTLLDDVLTPMNIVMQGYRCVFDGAAVAYDVISVDVGQEWRRKVRTLAGNWQLLSLNCRLAMPFVNPIWWRFLSHKIFRLLVPFALISALVSSTAMDGMLATSALICQLSLYGAAVAAKLVPATRENKVINLAFFFTVMNIAALVGFWRWITGQSASSWQPALKPLEKNLG